MEEKDQGILTFYPTWEDFKDFKSYIQSLERDNAHRTGLVKIVPPREYNPRRKGYFNCEDIDYIKIKHPKKQTFEKNKTEEGVFILNQTEFLLPIYKEDAKTNVNEYENVQNGNVIDNDDKTGVTEYENVQNENVIDKDDKTDLAALEENKDVIGNSVKKKEEPNYLRSYQFYRKTKAKPYKPPNVDPSNSLANDKERAAKIQKLLIDEFWIELEKYGTKRASIYGQGVDASLMDGELEHWNLDKLGSILDFWYEDEYLLNAPGILTSFIYYGMWRTAFAWHIEDMDLYSINYLHRGAPKVWYTLPPKDAKRFEKKMKELFVETDCDAPLRHKAYLTSPTWLRKNGFPVEMVIQEEGDLIITFPYGYHQGFNLGYNIAEASNFATPRWIRYGLNVIQCSCKGIDEINQIKMEIFTQKFPKYSIFKYGRHPIDDYDEEFDEKYLQSNLIVSNLVEVDKDDDNENQINLEDLEQIEEAIEEENNKLKEIESTFVLDDHEYGRRKQSDYGIMDSDKFQSNFKDKIESSTIDNNTTNDENDVTMMDEDEIENTYNDPHTPSSMDIDNNEEDEEEAKCEDYENDNLLISYEEFFIFVAEREFKKIMEKVDIIYNNKPNNNNNILNDEFKMKMDILQTNFKKYFDCVLSNLTLKMDDINLLFERLKINKTTSKIDYNVSRGYVPFAYLAEYWRDSGRHYCPVCQAQKVPKYKKNVYGTSKKLNVHWRSYHSKLSCSDNPYCVCPVLAYASPPHNCKFSKSTHFEVYRAQFYVFKEQDAVYTPKPKNEEETNTGEE